MSAITAPVDATLNGNAGDTPTSPSFDRDKPWYYEGQGSRTFELWVKEGFEEDDWQGRDNWWRIYDKYKEQLRPKYGEQRYLLRWNAEWMVFTHFNQKVTLEDFGAREPDPMPDWRIRHLEEVKKDRKIEERIYNHEISTNPSSGLKKASWCPKAAQENPSEGVLEVKAADAIALGDIHTATLTKGLEPLSVWQQMIADAERESRRESSQREQNNGKELTQEASESSSLHSKMDNSLIRFQKSRSSQEIARHEVHSGDKLRVASPHKAPILPDVRIAGDTGLPVLWTNDYVTKMGFVFFPEVTTSVRKEMERLYGKAYLRERDFLRKMSDIERLQWADEKRRRGLDVGSPLFDELEPEVQPIPLGTGLRARVSVYNAYKAKHDRRSEARNTEENDRQRWLSRDNRRKRPRYEADYYRPSQRQSGNGGNRETLNLDTSSSHTLAEMPNRGYSPNSARSHSPHQGKTSKESNVEKHVDAPRNYNRKIV